VSFQHPAEVLRAGHLHPVIVILTGTVMVLCAGLAASITVTITV
jgi:hypothetical protein